MAKRNSTVLVTGGAGYIGSHTVVELLEEGHEVLVIDNCVNSISGGANGHKPKSLQRVEKITGKKLKFFQQVSTFDEEALNKIFRNNKIDVVIHFAALKAVGESINEPLQYYKNNVGGTVSLLQIMEKHQVHNFIFSSSATVYGTPQYLPMDENHPTGQRITNPYGQTKFMVEQILKDLTVTNKKWKIFFLRYFNPVGAHISGMIGEDPKGIPNNLMPFISQVAVEAQPFLKIFGNNYDTRDGTGVRDYIHVVDLAKGHLSALTAILKPSFEGGWKAYNLGTGKGVSVMELAQEFSKVCGKEIPFEVVERRPGDLATVIASCDLAKDELNWEATKSVREMCEDTWRWQSSNPNGFSNLKPASHY